jgi:hypothetical protein
MGVIIDPEKLLNTLKITDYMIDYEVFTVYVKKKQAGKLWRYFEKHAYAKNFKAYGWKWVVV